MGKVISMRLSDAEEARLRGAAAVTGLSTSAYLKWLLVNGKSGVQNDTEMLLRRLDEIGVAIARLSPTHRASVVAPIAVPPKAAIVSGLKDRGIPTSTIRQVEAVLDQVARTTV